MHQEPLAGDLLLESDLDLVPLDSSHRVSFYSCSPFFSAHLLIEAGVLVALSENPADPDPETFLGREGPH